MTFNQFVIVIPTVMLVLSIVLMALEAHFRKVLQKQQANAESADQAKGD